MESGSGSEVLHIRLERDADGYPPFEFDEVQGQRIGVDTYKLLTAPTFAFGLAVGDVVTVAQYPDAPYALWVDELHVAGNHSTVRVIGLGGSQPIEPARIASDHGCVVTTTFVDRMIAIDIPPMADFPSLYQSLLRGRATGLWDVDVGVLSDTHSEQMRAAGTDL